MEVEPPRRHEEWSRQIDEAQVALAAGRLDEAQGTLARLDSLYSGGETPSAEQEQARQSLELQIADVRRQALEREREADIAAAGKAMDFGRFDEALRLTAEVTAKNPSPAQQERAAAIRVEVRRRQQVTKQWQVQLDMLASNNRRDVETAQAELRKDPDAAISLLAELSQRTDKPALVAAALETLATLDRPQQALPIVVEVLKRDNQRDLWQVATREIVRAGKPGAGQPLLELALSSAPVEQRLAALETLAQVADPPPRTLVALLPLLNDDGPLLRLALQSAAHSVGINEQFDLAAGAGVSGELTPAQSQQLAGLPQRLAALAAPKENPPSDVATAAQVLSVALRLTSPLPLKGIKVHQAIADLPDSPAAAAIDGVWAATELKTMWRHPAEPRGAITLDLGQERTVLAVKIWNWNEPGGTARGWKEVEILVGASDAELKPAAKGIVPPAPGAANTPDYGTLIAVPALRGRYVRLQAASLWQAGDHSGLAELEILGF